MHVASSLGQLDGIPLEGVKSYIRGAKSVQEVINMPYPGDEITKVWPSLTSSMCFVAARCQHGSNAVAKAACIATRDSTYADVYRPPLPTAAGKHGASLWPRWLLWTTLLP